MTKKIFLVFFFAFVIRLIALDQSLWLDEAVTAKVVMSYSYTEIINKFSPTDFHPPLYYLFMKAWTNVFGYSEVALRMPSVLFCLMSGYLIYLIGGIWAATFFLLNPLIIYYSQDARMYMMATFFIAVNFSFYLALSDERSPQGQKPIAMTTISSVCFILTILLSMLTFYGSIFYFGAVIIFTFFKKQFKLFALSVLSLVGSLVLLYPLLSVQMQYSGVVLTQVKNWRATLGTVTVKQLILFPLKFATGRISFEPKSLYFLIGGIWAAFLGLVIVKEIPRIASLPRNDTDTGQARMTLLFFTVIPITLGVIISFHTPLLQYFRFQFVIIFLSILLAVSTIKYPRLRTVIIIGSVIWSFVYLVNPSFHREDWKELSVNLLSENKPVYIVASSADPLTYYVPFLASRSLESLVSVSPQEDKIIIIPYTADIHGINYKKELTKYKYELLEQKNVHGIDYEIWKRSGTFYVKDSLRDSSTPLGMTFVIQ